VSIESRSRSRGNESSTRKLGAELDSYCKHDDNDVAPGNPSCGWDDVQVREALVDTFARDAYAVLAARAGRTLTSEVTSATS